MEWNRVIRELELTKKDRIGFIALAFLVLLATFLPGFFKNHYAKRDLVSYDSAWIAEMEQWRADSAQEEFSGTGTRDWRNRPQSYSKTPERALNPFPFDPNTLDETGWKSLGLPDRTIRVILNYRGKGGRIRRKEDLSKIYGITAEQFRILEPFIQLPEISPRSFEPFPAKTDRSTAIISVVDINRADTSAFIALPGIGSKLAGRIVAFREKLGAFYSVGQVKEVYGLADSVFQKLEAYLVLGESQLRKININSASEEELRMHPYIRYSLAKPIIAYRAAHGNFASVEDLKKVMAITQDIYEKVKHYISVD